MDRRQAAAWLAGFIDGEGCVHERKKAYSYGRYHARVVTITNTDKALVDFAERCFELLQIPTRRYARPGQTKERKRRFIIEVGRRAGFERLLRLVPLQAPDKKRKLAAMVAGLPAHRCARCNCPRDRQTKGCSACEQRHYWRRRKGRA